MDNVIKLKQEANIRKTLKNAIRVTNENGDFFEEQSVTAVLLYEILNELKFARKVLP